MSDDTPFNVLIQQSIDLKYAQLALDRKKYDSNIKWYRDSLFAKEVASLLCVCLIVINCLMFQDIVKVRNSDDFDKIMEFSMACREEGNNLVKMQEYEQAIAQYERAVSVWKWIESTIPDWRKQVNRILKI